MATRTTVTLIDDLEGTTAEESVRFGLDGGEYEIDVSAANASALRDVLADYIAAARRQGGRRTTSRRATSTAATTTASGPKRSREQNQQIRTWVVEHGAFVPERGRIPGLMVAAYEAGDPSMLPAAAPDTPETDGPPRPTTPTDSPVPDNSETPEPAPAGDEQPRGRDGLTATEREAIRAWAVEEGIEVKGRGQLKKDLIANYRAVAARR